MINFLLLVSRQGKTRLSKWYEHYPAKEKARAIRELTTLVLARAPKMCNFIEWRDKKGTKVDYAVRMIICNVCWSLDFCCLAEYYARLWVVDHDGDQIVYKRYASLFFIAAVENTDNELITLEMIHLFVEILDRYFGNVCELDIIFNFHKAYYILDELFIGGQLQESSKNEVLRVCSQMDELMEEQKDDNLASMVAQMSRTR